MQHSNRYDHKLVMWVLLCIRKNYCINLSVGAYLSSDLDYCDCDQQAFTFWPFLALSSSDQLSHRTTFPFKSSLSCNDIWPILHSSCLIPCINNGMVMVMLLRKWDHWTMALSIVMSFHPVRYRWRNQEIRCFLLALQRKTLRKRFIFGPSKRSGDKLVKQDDEAFCALSFDTSQPRDQTAR